MEDTGHNCLLHDLDALRMDAYNMHFHDFDSSFATPKVMLVQRLEAIIEQVKKGRYDN